MPQQRSLRRSPSLTARLNDILTEISRTVTLHGETASVAFPADAAPLLFRFFPLAILVSHRIPLDMTPSRLLEFRVRPALLFSCLLLMVCGCATTEFVHLREKPHNPLADSLWPGKVFSAHRSVSSSNRISGSGKLKGYDPARPGAD